MDQFGKGNMDFKFLAFVLLFVSKISLEQLQLQHGFLFSCFHVAFRLPAATFRRQITCEKQHELHFSCMRVASTIEIPGNDLGKATHMLSFNQICCFSSTNGRLLRGLIKVHRRRLLLICKANQ